MLVGPVAVLVLLGDPELLEVGLGAGVVDPLAEGGAVLERDPQVGVGDVDVEAAALEAELLDHEVVEQADDVGAGADDVVGVGERALERARAAEPLAALEHEHGLAGAGEVGGAGEPVVAAADDDRVPVAGGELLHGRGQADLAQLLRDGVHLADLLGDGVDDDGALFVDEDGVALDQLEAGELRERGREAGGGGEVGAGEQRARRGGCASAASTRSGVAGSGTTATSSNASA